MENELPIGEFGNLQKHGKLYPHFEFPDSNGDGCFVFSHEFSQCFSETVKSNGNTELENETSLGTLQRSSIISRTISCYMTWHTY